MFLSVPRDILTDVLYSVDIWSVVFLIILLMAKNIEFVPGYAGIMEWNKNIHGGAESCPGEGMEMGKALEHKPDGEWLRKLGVQIPEH